MTTAAPRILLVEDDPEQAILFGKVLRSSGYTVDVAANASQAQKDLDEAPFTLLLADWSLPGMQGDALVSQAKAQHPEMKTVLFSNHSNVDQAATAAGADAWFRKIDGVARLRQLIKELLSKEPEQD
jgi:DNA-binding NtrC family response regulator